MSTLYLIRHSQASFGKSDYDRLSNLGHLQSKILADHFDNLKFKFNAIYSGSLLRHEQTLSAYLDVLTTSKRELPPVRKTDAFDEYDSENILKTLIPEMILKDAAFEAEVTKMFSDKRSFQKVYEKIMRQWINSENPIKNLETWNTYCEKVVSKLQKIMTSEGAGKNVAVFTSGGPISVIVQKALNLSNEDTLQLTWQIMNASLTRLIYSGNRLMLSGFNDVTHLELHKDRNLLTYR
jgi:broad specificity phosphatase PhoE